MMVILNVGNFSVKLILGTYLYLFWYVFDKSTSNTGWELIVLDTQVVIS